MIFDDNQNPTILVTLTPRRIVGELCNCLLTVSKNGVVTESYEGMEPIKNLEALATWVDTLWNEVPDLVLESVPLCLAYGHREHIGEGFYGVNINEKPIAYVYEQINQSNTARAQMLRNELAELTQ